MKKTLIALSAYALPALAFAQNSAELTNVQTLLVNVGKVMNLLVPIIFTLALLYFFWGLANYILKAGEEKEEGKNIMIWGIVALFVMASVWGIINFISSSFGLNNEQAPNLPNLIFDNK